MKKKIFKNKCQLFFTLALLALSKSMYGQTQASPQVINTSISSILGAMPGGFVLPDGNIVYAERITVGTADPTPGYGSGATGGLSFSGGVLPGYLGSQSNSFFTGIATPNTNSMRNGAYGLSPTFAPPGNSYQNSLGFHFWYKNVVNNVQMLFADLDGTAYSNGEWVTSFAYNPTGTRIIPTASILTGATAGQDLIPNPIVADTWNSMLSGVSNLPAGYQAFRSISNNVPTITNNPTFAQRKVGSNGNYPLNLAPLEGQALFDFSDQSVNHVFTFWGITGNISNPNTAQNSVNSGISTIIYPDFGDAPDSYSTNFLNTVGTGNVGAHGYGTSLLTIGVNQSTESNARGITADANSDTDDDGVVNGTGNPGYVGGTLTNNIVVPVSVGVETTTLSGYSVNVVVKNQTSKAAKLIGWIDWNNNGAFENTEDVSINIPSSTAASQTVTLTWVNQLIGNISRGNTYLRLRLSTDAAFNENSFSGALSDGEIEDYKINIVRDSDNDGIIDENDLDDDNDGILDKVECPSFLSFGGFSSASVPTSSWYMAQFDLVGLPTGAPYAPVARPMNVGSAVYNYGGQPTYAGNSPITGGLFDEVDGVNTTGGLEYALMESDPNRPLVGVLTSPLVAGKTYSVSADIGARVDAGMSTTTKYVLLMYNRTTGMTEDMVADGILSTLPGPAGLPPYKTVSGSFVAQNSGNYSILIYTTGAGGVEDDFFVDRVAIKGVCDSDGDGLPDINDLDTDGDGCSDAIEGAAAFTNANLVTSSIPGGNSGSTYTGTSSSPVVSNLGNTVGSTPTTIGVPTIAGVGQAIGTSQNGSLQDPACTPPFCYKPGITGGTILTTQHGITALNRAGADNGNWPMVRKGAWTVLESKTKGFVINRIATTAAVNAIANPVEGMMVYDEEEDCIKINTTGTAAGWKCFNVQACPD